MCGIIGYVGNQCAREILIEALKRLEYRGYDSAGIGIQDLQGMRVVRSVGRLASLLAKLAPMQPVGTVGIGHTRWATHGRVTETNAHPQMSCDGKIAIVHNGVVENFQAIKEFLLARGYSFASETDTEVLANLIAYHYAKERATDGASHFYESVRKALLHVRGTYGLVVLCSDFPDEMVGARNSSPLILGVGSEEFFLCSDVSGFAARTRDVVFLKDGELVHVKRSGFSIGTLGKENIEASPQEIDWQTQEMGLGNFPTYMLKEIFEQPQSLENAMRGRFSEDGSTAHFGGLQMTARELRQVDRIIFCGCGTAWHACLVAEYLIERFARIPVEVEYASEFRYRNAPLERNTLVVVVSQSGETIDTLAALKEAQRKGFRVLSITNVVGSTIAREADGGIYQHSGPEIGVASTKAFTGQLCVLSLFALYLARLRDMAHETGCEIVRAMRDLPRQAAVILDMNEELRRIAERYSGYGHMLFLGRQGLFPIALEGALKLKEISYVHAEGYPSAEMKHGPIALVSPDCPAFVLSCESQIFEKTLSNIHELKARGAKIIALATDQEKFPPDLADDLIRIPATHPLLQSILATIPLQLFAHHIGQLRNCDVDKPRNLAKSVTVE